MANRIVILGGSGFIGTRLARRLLTAESAVTIADLSPSAAFPDRWQRCDITDPTALEATLAGADLVYNLAAVHGDEIADEKLYDTVNVGGAQNLCAAAERCGLQRIIYVSSIAVYGATDRELDESAPLQPTNAYGQSKAAAEAVYRAWFARGNRRSLTIVRPATVFGPGNRANIYQLMRAVARDSFRMVGRGENRKSIAYVENVAAFLQFVADLPTGETILNYADKPDPTMNELVAAVRGALGQPPVAGFHWPYALGCCAAWLIAWVNRLRGRPATATVARLRKFTANTQYSTARALATGFRPVIPLDQALRDTVVSEFGSNNA